MATDVVALGAGWALGAATAATITGIETRPLEFALDSAVGVAVSLTLFALAGLYRAPINAIRSPVLRHIVRALTVAAVTVTILHTVIDSAAPWRTAWVAGVALVVVTVARYAFEIWLVGCREYDRFCTRVVVAGSASESLSLIEFLEHNQEAGFRATGIVGDRPELADGHTFTTPWLGGLDEALAAVRHTSASGLLVAVSGMSSDALNELVHRVSGAGVPVHLWNGLTRVSNTRIRSLAVAHEPFVVVDPPSHGSAQRFGKRLLDVTLSLVLIVLAAPLMAIAAALIWAHDRGPVLFRQVRIGKDGRPFTVFKLRTMEVDAEARVAELWELNERSGPLFKVARDPRVTPVGNFLRSSALDELPQLFNVLAGQMSMVGPRPALPSETAEFDADLQRRHLTKPGVTGLWQVEANHKESFDEYRRLDLFYVDNWSVALDLSIIVDTVPSIGRRALRALRRSAPSAPVPITSSPPVPTPVEAGP